MTVLKMNEELKAIAVLNDRIKQAEESLNKKTNELDEAESAYSRIFEQVALGSATESDIGKARERIVKAKDGLAIAEERLIAVKSARKNRMVIAEKEIEKALSETAEYLQAEYDEAFKNDVINARNSYVEALAKLGDVLKRMSKANGEASDLRRIAGVSMDRNHTKRKQIRTASFNNTQWFDGQPGHGIDEQTQINIANGERIPDHLKY